MDLEGTQFGHYRLVRLIGSGGMGEVYLAEDTRIVRNVAIKVVRNEAHPYPNATVTQEAIRLFEREMKAITSLDHPNILPLLDFGEETVNKAVFTYMVMPFRAEGSLVDWQHEENKEGIVPSQEVVHIVLQAAAALQHAHNHHLVHLDVKPANFLMRRQDDPARLPDVLLADFGIAKFNTATATTSQSVRGTFVYMAPEQWSGQPVPATDQYALAIMAYQLLTGNLPFQGSMQQVMYQHLQTPPQPPSALNPQIPPAVDNILLRALAKKPEDRFPSIQAFADAFAQAWSGKSTVAPPQLQSTQYSTTRPSTTPIPIASLTRTQFVPPIALSSSSYFGLPRFALFAGVIILVLVIVVGGFAFALANRPSSGNNSTSSGSGNSSPVASAPTATPTATSAPTPTPTPSPTSTPSPTPSPTPAPKPGDILYQADWSNGMNGWLASNGWNTSNGLLVNDGTQYCLACDPQILAPYQPGSIANYSVQADIQLVQYSNSAEDSFGIVVRSPNEGGGYKIGICASAGLYSCGTNAYEILLANGSFYQDHPIGEAAFNPQRAQWHTYRVDVQNNTIKVFVDGGLAIQATDNKYLAGGRVGLWSDQCQVSIRNFKIIQL